MRDETKPHKIKNKGGDLKNTQDAKSIRKDFTMKNLFAIIHAENTIIASKTTLKKASVPNSPEYKELMKLMKKHPTYAIAEKEIKKAEGKKTYEGLNKAFIEKYISIQDNAGDLNEQYAKASEMGKFPLVRKWFLNTFENFDMATAKKEIEQAIFAEIASAAEKKPAVITKTEQKVA